MKSHGMPASISITPSIPEACPICRASEIVSCPPGRDRLFGRAKGLFALFRCQACGCVFQHPFPDSSALAEFYPQEYWWSESPSQENRWARLFHRLEKAYREFVTRDHVRFLNQCVSGRSGSEKLLLDIGCGNGTFLHGAQKIGFHPHGMDVSAQAVEIARAQYGIETRQGEIGDSIWDGKRFDFITMFHVLEHLPDPRRALQYVRELLLPSGKLIIQVPNAGSVQARALGRFWYGLDVPRHVINFTPEALSHLLREMGFEFYLSTRFSLRDNPASMVSSLVPWLDPVRRKGKSRLGPVSEGLLEIAYFGLFLLAAPAAILESLSGVGGTIWVCAWDKPSKG